MNTRERFFYPGWRLFLFIALLISIYVLSAYLQFRGLISADLSASLEETRLLLSGKSYLHGFFETSPPMFLYLNIPIIFLEKMSLLSLPSIINAYYFFLISITLLASYFLLKKIFLQKDSMILGIFLLLMAIELLILPFPAYFGEREHEFIILSLPYFILISLRLEKTHVNVYFSVFIGLMAGIAFGIKPQFYIALLSMELFLLVKNKNLLSWARPEFLVIFAISLIYTVTSFILYPAYFKIILPLASQFYYLSMTGSYFEALRGKVFIYCMLIVIFNLIEFKNNRYKSLSLTLLIGILSLVLVYLSQIVAWYYHAFPAYFLSLLLLFLLFFSLLNNKNINATRIVSYAFVMILFYSFNPILFAINDKNYLLFTCLLIFIALFTYILIRIKSKSTWGLLIIFLAATIFLPLKMIATDIFFSKIDKKEKEVIIAFMNQHTKNKTVYFLTTRTDLEFSQIDYTTSINLTRFNLVWVPAYVRSLHEKNRGATFDKLNNINNIFVKMIVNDLNNKKPDFIFVDNSQHQLFLYGMHVNYIALFSLSSGFLNAWKQYHYFATINSEPNYTIDIYERNKEK